MPPPRHFSLHPSEDRLAPDRFPPAAWLMESLERAGRLARGREMEGAGRIRLEIDSSLGPEALRISGVTPDGKAVVTGGDVAGVARGCLDLRDAVRAETFPEGWAARGEHRPAFSVRALKINLPWASYRQHASLDQHGETMRNPDFWERLLDFMAECRLNLLSLWSLHPFYYMVDLPDYPEARTFSEAEMAQWQALWLRVFALARERGIQSHVFFWNIFVSPAFARHHGVCSYCHDWDYIGDGETSPLIEAYNRACVRTLIDTYEDLTGIGVAMSERMGGMTAEERADWIERVTVAGMSEARRPADLCLRIPHSAGLDNAGKTTRESELLGRRLLERVRVPGRLWTEVKFNWSHGHSTPRLRKIHGGPPTDVLWNPPPTAYEVSWMVRNEDFFVLRWGEPDFIREHLRINGIPGVCGYFIGSECHIPARDAITRPETGADWTYGFERSWLFHHLWGRLLCDPRTPDSVFEDLIDRRHGVGTGRPLLKAMRRVGAIPRFIAIFLNFTWDHTLYAEGLLVREGPVTLERLIASEPIEPDWLSIPAFLDAESAGRPVEGKRTPPELAGKIESEVRAALAALEPIAEASGPLAHEVADVQAWALLGRCFADKVRAAVELARARREQSPERLEHARTLLARAVGHWVELARLTEERTRPIPLQILGDRLFSWRELEADVRAEVQRLSLEPPA
ncbi:MAG: hypothetical protein EA425_10395 [Puniceicoccaceae bacterium]|nr:MAG: hypothetical protein EA425_10395 [Puniceicoccaceae bacterium]